MEPHERLSKAINERRLELRLQWKQVAAGAGISPESLGAIRRGDYRPSELTARGLDETLRWQPGSVYAILDQEAEPVPVTTVPTAEVTANSAVVFTTTARTTARRAALRLIDSARGAAPVEAAAAIAGITSEQWQDIIRGATKATPDQLARMARSVGVQTFQLRQAGEPEAADALHRIESQDRHGHKSTEQLTQETAEIFTGFKEKMRAVLEERGVIVPEDQWERNEPMIEALAKILIQASSPPPS